MDIAKRIMQQPHQKVAVLVPICIYKRTVCRKGHWIRLIKPSQFEILLDMSGPSGDREKISKKHVDFP